ncbi:MAG: PAS domain-containing protein [Alphaproteobacteria bacterium]|nr:PAS domain-containing protein [Alphaproteobacteria bacterium]
MEALTDFLHAMPADSGACVVFVQHLDPHHESVLDELLRRHTDMKVLQASENLVPEPNSVVLIPPNSTLTYGGGALHLQVPAPPRQHRTPIDTFFQSLAMAEEDAAICVLLSGTGSDGSHGLGLVKEAGGLTVVQAPATAKYDSMPRAAMATGLVDYELAPADMPAVLMEHLQKLRILRDEGGLKRLKEQMTSDLSKICAILGTRTGHDFRGYKEATLLRRIHRRMQVLKIAGSGDYVDRLRSDPAEVGKLFRELLISVTGFFRDMAAFDALTELALGPLLVDRGGETLRIWVPACATGEEAYTLAMILHHRAELASRRLKVQLFATDIDEPALEVARRGCYPAAAVARVPEPYLSRYFRQDGSEFRVADELREMCIFSTQSVIKDPPFSRLDLLSCRNLMIYLNAEMQNRLVPVFHYALRTGGVLFLGPSENITKYQKLFETLDGKWRIFRRKDADGRPASLFPFRANFTAQEPPGRERLAGGRAEHSASSVVAQAERLVLDRLGPAYAVISRDREVLYTGGPIERYLAVPRGASTQELLSMTKQELRLDVRAVIHRAFIEREKPVRQTVVFAEDGRWTRLRLECLPLGTDGAREAHVLAFHDCGRVDPGDAAQRTGTDASVDALERELVATREYLQTTTEELESSNEELKSANEELMSMNEELQSSNEELETSKEELQSVNEELETVNAELLAKVDEVTRGSSDLQNLLESTQIATLFLDRTLRVRRFTPMAKELFHLIDQDVGRSIADIMSRIEEEDMEDVFQQALAAQLAVERRVRLRGGENGRVFIMRILPYKTLTGLIDGIVATFVDVTDLDAAEGAAKRRAEQQDFISVVTGSILRGERTSAIVASAPSRIAALMRADFVKLLRKLPGRDDFELIGGFGFSEAVGTLVPGSVDSQAGFALRTGEPVIVEDLREETRFVPPELLTRNGVRSGITVVVAGPEGDWGVVGAHSSHERSFSRDDINFIQSFANVLSAGLQGEASVRALEESEERLASALAAGQLGVHDFDPASGYVKWDERIYRLWGVPEDQPVTYETFLSGVHPDDRPVVQRAVDAAVDPAGDGSYESVFRVINATDGGVRWIRADGKVTFENGAAARLVGTVMDITEKRRAEEHVQMLMREVNHRAKNLLAVVQAIARQTAKASSPGEFARILGQRLQGLAAAQDLIIRGDWRAVAMSELAKSQISHLGERSHARVRMEGERVLLTTEAAQGIGLALHELATNAVKYGALSNETGQVTLRWALEGDRFVISWDEQGGPAVKPPVRRGFGTTVVERMAASAVRGEVELEFPPEGLRWHLSAPAAEVIYEPSAGTGPRQVDHEAADGTS